MTIFQNQTYTALKAGSLILPPFGKINRENYHKIHSLPLANKQKKSWVFAGFMPFIFIAISSPTGPLLRFPAVRQDKPEPGRNSFYCVAGR